MVEPSIRDYLIDLYDRSLFLNEDSIYNNYKYRVEDDKLVLISFVNIDIVKEQLKNNGYLFIDPYFDVCRLYINLGVLDDYFYFRIELGNSFERIDLFLMDYKQDFKVNTELHAHSVTKINDEAFYETFFPTIFRGNNVREIGKSAFECNQAIKEVYVPKCEFFDNFCFMSSYLLSDIESNASKIGYHAFFDTYLNSIKANGNVRIYNSDSELLEKLVYNEEKE